MAKPGIKASRVRRRWRSRSQCLSFGTQPRKAKTTPVQSLTSRCGCHSSSLKSQELHHCKELSTDDQLPEHWRRQPNSSTDVSVVARLVLLSELAGWHLQQPVK
eukprot:1160751-Amphidinium_carterae.1